MPSISDQCLTTHKISFSMELERILVLQLGAWSRSWSRWRSSTPFVTTSASSSPFLCSHHISSLSRQVQAQWLLLKTPDQGSAQCIVTDITSQSQHTQKMQGGGGADKNSLLYKPNISFHYTDYRDAVTSTIWEWSLKSVREGTETKFFVFTFSILTKPVSLKQILYYACV